MSENQTLRQTALQTANNDCFRFYRFSDLYPSLFHFLDVPSFVAVGGSNLNASSFRSVMPSSTLVFGSGFTNSTPCFWMTLSNEDKVIRIPSRKLFRDASASLLGSLPAWSAAAFASRCSMATTKSSRKSAIADANCSDSRVLDFLSCHQWSQSAAITHQSPTNHPPPITNPTQKTTPHSQSPLTPKASTTHGR